MDRNSFGIRSYDLGIQIKREDIQECGYMSMHRSNSNTTADSACFLDTNSEQSGYSNYSGMENDNYSPSWGGDSQDSYRGKLEYDDASFYGSQDGSLASPMSGYGEASSMTSSWMNSSQNMSFSSIQQQLPHQHQHHNQQTYSPTQNWQGSDFDSMDYSNQSGSLSPTSEKKFVCLVGGCPSKPFGRSADLDRHQKQVHKKEGAKEKFFCDYRNCQRKDGFFGRKDHFRDHFRDYHKEDIPQRGKSVSKHWNEERYITPDWWRCSKCLRRMDVAEVGYECRCKFLCEPERRDSRESKRLEALMASGQR